MLELWGLKLKVKGEEGSASSIQGLGLKQRVETRPTQYGCRTECYAVSVRVLNSLIDLHLDPVDLLGS